MRGEFDPDFWDKVHAKEGSKAAVVSLLEKWERSLRYESTQLVHISASRRAAEKADLLAMALVHLKN
jgi:hypothetical protein